MRKPAKAGQKLLFFLLFTALILLWFFLELPCIPRLVTGLICPGCGMSRAWLAVMHLEFGQAFSCHPMFWSVPIFMLYILCDGQLFRNRRVNNWVLGGLLGLFFLCYLIRLWAFLGGFLSI